MFVVCENKYYNDCFISCNLICAGKSRLECLSKMFDCKNELMKLYDYQYNRYKVWDDYIEIDFKNGDFYRIQLVDNVEEV